MQPFKLQNPVSDERLVAYFKLTLTVDGPEKVSKDVRVLEMTNLLRWKCCGADLQGCECARNDHFNYAGNLIAFKVRDRFAEVRCARRPALGPELTRQGIVNRHAFYRENIHWNFGQLSKVLFTDEYRI